MLAEFRSPTYSSRRTTDGDFLLPHPVSAPPAAFSPNTVLSARALPDWASLAPNSSGQLWGWSPLPPRGPSRYCQSEVGEEDQPTSEDQFGGDTRCRLSEKGSTKTQG